MKRADCTAESDNHLTKLQARLVYLIPQLSKFPRDQKFVLGDRIKTKVLAVPEHCLRAYYSRDKRTHLLEANLTVVVTRHLIRLAHALRLVSHHTYGVLAEQMDEVGRMIGGWLKTQAVMGAPGGNGARTFLSAGPCLQVSFSRKATAAWSVLCGEKAGRAGVLKSQHCLDVALNWTWRLPARAGLWAAGNRPRNSLPGVGSENDWPPPVVRPGLRAG
ncbi:MAG: diversity-generating retroelement protein Avd [Verrucomicrobiota bacterium]